MSSVCLRLEYKLRFEEPKSNVGIFRIDANIHSLLSDFLRLTLRVKLGCSKKLAVRVPIKPALHKDESNVYNKNLQCTVIGLPTQQDSELK